MFPDFVDLGNVQECQLSNHQPTARAAHVSGAAALVMALIKNPTYSKPSEVMAKGVQRRLVSLVLASYLQSTLMASISVYGPFKIAMRQLSKPIGRYSREPILGESQPYRSFMLKLPQICHGFVWTPYLSIETI